MRIVSAIVLIAALEFSLAACGGGQSRDRHHNVRRRSRYSRWHRPDSGAARRYPAGRPSTLIAFQTTEEPRRFPLEFATPYEPEDIGPRATYRLQVSVTLGIRLIYANDTAFHVLTNGTPIRRVDM